MVNMTLRAPMRQQKPAILLFVLSAATLPSTLTLAQPPTSVPQITVVAPAGTNAEIVSVETRVVAPGEIQIGTPTVEEATTVVPMQDSPSASQDVHLQINLRLRMELPAPPPSVQAAPIVHAAPVVLPQVTLPERAPQHLQLRLEAPRRRYALPISFMAAGGITTILGGMTAAFEEELMFLPAIGAGLLITGIVTMILRVSRYRRARREYERQAQFTF